MAHRLALALILCSLSILTLSPEGWPHPGSLDEHGCHSDRKHGGYHCHKGGLAGQSFASQKDMLANRQESYTAIPPTLPSQQFSGKVVAVKDGDTISVLHSGKREEIRLNGIDCPEKDQSFGAEATKFTSQLALGKDVTVTSHGVDKYGRTIGDIVLLDGTKVNQELVRAGLAWWFRRCQRSCETPPAVII